MSFTNDPNRVNIGMSAFSITTLTAAALLPCTYILMIIMWPRYMTLRRACGAYRYTVPGIHYDYDAARVSCQCFPTRVSVISIKYIYSFVFAVPLTRDAGPIKF